MENNFWEEKIFQSIVTYLLIVNPIMPNRYFYTSVLFIVFKKQMLQGANTDLFNPLVSKAHNSQCQNAVFP